MADATTKTRDAIAHHLASRSDLLARQRQGRDHALLCVAPEPADIAGSPRAPLTDEQATGTQISDHLGLHTVELRKWRKPAAPLAPADQWVYLLREGRNWDDLPADLQSPEMRKAMAILDQISEKTRDYLRYQARQNFLREQRTMERLMEEERQGRREAIEQLEQALTAKEQERAAKEQALTAKEQALTAKEQERAAKEAALAAEHAARAEAEQLRARLRALGIDPDAP